MSQQQVLHVIVTGSPTFTDEAAIKGFIAKHLSSTVGLCNVQIMVADERGAADVAFEYSKERGWQGRKFPLDVKRYEKTAVYMRMVEMAKKAHMFIAFWDEEDPRTKHYIQIAQQNRLQKFVYFTKHPNGEAPEPVEIEGEVDMQMEG